MLCRILACLCVFGLVSTLPHTADAQSDTFSVVAPWVVIVYQSDGKRASFGSGFVSSTGYVVTAAHVILSEKLPVHLATQGDLTPDRMRDAKIVAIDRDSDIAILDGGYVPPVGLLPQQIPPSTGDEVWIFGYEFVGNRAAILRIARGSIGQLFEDAFQLDAPIQHGFSGGPVTTRGGRVVGIISFGFRGGNPSLAYIVPDKPIQDELSALAPRTPPTTVAQVPIIPPLPQGPPPVPAVRDTLVVPGQRLGPLTLTTSLNQMNAILGEPPDVTSDTSSGKTFTWKKYGVMVSLDATGTPIIVGSWNPAFVTAQGIRVGANVDAVERTYGLNYQMSWADNRATYGMIYNNGLMFVVDPSTRAVIAVAVGRPIPTAGMSVGQNAISLTGSYIGTWETVGPNLYEMVFQLTQTGNDIITGSLTSNAGRSGIVSGVIEGNRIRATITFTDKCSGQATALIDIVDGGRRLVGNYTATDCLGTYSRGFILNRQ